MAEPRKKKPKPIKSSWGTWEYREGYFRAWFISYERRGSDYPYQFYRRFATVRASGVGWDVTIYHPQVSANSIAPGKPTPDELVESLGYEHSVDDLPSAEIGRATVETYFSEFPMRMR